MFVFFGGKNDKFEGKKSIIFVDAMEMQFQW